MPKSLAELRASETVGAAEESYRLNLSQKLRSRIGKLRQELVALEIDLAAARNPTQQQQDADGDAASPPRRMMDGPDHEQVSAIEARIGEINADLAAAWSEMRESDGDLLLRAIPLGDWRRWAQAHPARRKNEGTPDQPTWVTNPFDEDFGYGYVNVDDLLPKLGEFAVSWNGIAINVDDGEWDFIARNAGGDLKEIAKLVVLMHEGRGARAPKASPKPSSTSPTSESDLS